MPRRALTVLLALLLLWWLRPVLDWAVLHAVLQPNEAACRAAQGQGACWGVVIEKLQPILLGRYPQDQAWRPAWACAVLALLVVVSAQPRCWRWALLPAWGLGLALFALLMGGGHFELHA